MEDYKKGALALHKAKVRSYFMFFIVIGYSLMQLIYSPIYSNKIAGILLLLFSLTFIDISLKIVDRFDRLWDSVTRGYTISTIFLFLISLILFFN